MGIKVTNNAFGALTSGITTGDTTIVLGSGEGARFPALGSGDFFFGTLIDTGNNLEIVKVTARSVDTMTIVRGQDGTTARNYTAGDRFELRPTAAMFQAFTQADGIAYDNTASGLSATDAQAALDELQADKQATLVSGSNIKTVGGESILGSGNIVAGGDYIMRTYTAPATWTKPAGLKAVKVTVVGGGGGGAGARRTAPPTIANPARYGGQGGGSGAAVRYIPAPSIPGPVAVTRGAGGAGGPFPPGSGITAGGAGGTSSFGAFVSATGGSGSPNADVGVPGSRDIAPGGSGSGGDINFTAPALVSTSFGGSVPDTGGTVPTIGFAGQAALFGGDQLRTRTTSGAGATPSSIGCGGTGGRAAPSPGTTGGAGGAGAPGIVIVEEFY